MKEDTRRSSPPGDRRHGAVEPTVGTTSNIKGIVIEADASVVIVLLGAGRGANQLRSAVNL
jgi:hypothetical protein